MAAPMLQMRPGLDLKKEYIGGGPLSYLTQALSGIIQALPGYQDAATRKGGPNIYRDVARDATVKGNLSVLVGLVLQEGLRWECAIEAPEPKELGGEPDAAELARYEEAEAARDRFVAELEAMKRPLHLAIREAFGGMLRFGHKTCEIVYEDGPEGIRIKAVKPKNQRSITLYIDGTGEFVGALPAASAVLTPKAEDLLPREKFLLFTNEEEDGDIRGVSLLEPVYDWWYIKKHILPALLKYLAQFGGPSLILIAGEESEDEPQLDANGNQVLDDQENPIVQTAVQKLYEAGVGFLSGSVLAVEHGADAKTLFAGGNGEAFVNCIRALIDVQITQAMLGQARATLEAQNGSKADSQGGKDILDMIVEGYRNYLEASLTEGLSKSWTALNFGEENLWMAPRAVLSSPPQEDLAATSNAFATLFSAGAIADEQLPWWDKKIGMPARNMANWTAAKSAEADLQSMLATERTRALDPTYAPPGAGE